MYFCLKCKEKGEHEHKLEKLKGMAGIESLGDIEKMDKGEMNED